MKDELGQFIYGYKRPNGTVVLDTENTSGWLVALMAGFKLNFEVVEYVLTESRSLIPIPPENSHE